MHLVQIGRVAAALQRQDPHEATIMASTAKQDADPVPLPGASLTPATSQNWGPARRAVFRFLLIYLLLYNTKLPGEALWGKLVPWVGKQVFNLEAVARVTGSGDTAYHYLQAFCVLVISAGLAAVWSLCDARRLGYPSLFETLASPPGI
jgi:hypothetical protein